MAGFLGISGRRIKGWVTALLICLPFAAAIGAAASYERALSAVLVSEGYVYSNVPGDPGGPTKYGITIYDVRKYLIPHATAADVRALDLDDAKVIYRLHYWNAVNGDNLPPGLDYTLFDYAVNAGPSRALKTYAQCKSGNTLAEIRCVNDRRMAFQMGLPHRLDKFKKGWSRRIRAVKNISLQMAGERGYKAGMLDLYSIPRIGIGKAYEEIPE